MSLSQNFATVRPSLSLDFANTKRLDPRITFTRAATAKYYDGVTTAKAEENLALQSQTFATSPWIANAVTLIANSTTAPDGTTTAFTLTNNTSNSAHGVYQTLTTAVGATYSCYAKAGTTNYLGITNTSANSAYSGAVFDLTAGTVVTTSNCTASITSVGNGWYRCVAANTTTYAGQYFVASVLESNITPWTAYVGTGLNIYIWGAQVEQRSSVTAYTPTTTQAITNYIPVLQTAAADTARFDHNPITGESLGLLIEEARTNLYTYSDDFSNAAWTLLNSAITSNTIIAPDGTLSGDKVTASTAASYYVYRSTTANTYTLSMYMKAASSSTGGLYATGGVNCNAVFNLSTGVVTSVTNGTAAITSVGNGWYRCSVTYTTSSSGNSGFYLSTAAAGDSVYIWGAQLEAGSFATSYIPTVASQVTRAADAASMTGTNFSSWYRIDEGTLYTEFKANTASVTQIFAQLDDGSTNNAIYLITSPSSSGSDRFQVNTSGVTQAALGASGFVPTNSNKYAGAYKVNDFERSLNGASLTDTLGTVPVVNTLRIGNSSSYFLNGTMKKLAYYPKRITSAQLQALTLS